MKSTQSLIDHLLPTEDASILCIIDGGLVYAQYGKKIFGVGSIKGTVNQHLYLCSTLPIKEGDWVLCKDSYAPVKYCSTNSEYANSEMIKHDGYWKKIEFTTDSKLTKCGCGLSGKWVDHEDGMYQEHKLGCETKSFVGVGAIDMNTKILVTLSKDAQVEGMSKQIKVNFLEEYCKRYNQEEKFDVPNKTDKELIGMIIGKDNQKGFDLNKCVESFERALKKYPKEVERIIAELEGKYGEGIYESQNQKGVDVEKLAEEKYPMEGVAVIKDGEITRSGLSMAQQVAFVEGFKANQALQSNAVFSLEDMKKAMSKAIDISLLESYNAKVENRKVREDDVVFEKYIQSLTKEQSNAEIGKIPAYDTGLTAEESKVEKLADAQYKKYEPIESPKYISEQAIFVMGFADGYNQALQSNVGFSLEEVKKAIARGRNTRIDKRKGMVYEFDYEQIIQSLTKEQSKNNQNEQRKS